MTRFTLTRHPLRSLFSLALLLWALVAQTALAADFAAAPLGCVEATVAAPCDDLSHAHDASAGATESERGDGDGTPLATPPPRQPLLSRQAPPPPLAAQLPSPHLPGALRPPNAV